jgi:hypothetical protein
MRKHTNVGKPLELRGVRIIYQVGQITHRTITTNKRDQVIVTMHASKLKTKQEHNILELGLNVDKERSPISETIFGGRPKTRLDS